MSRELKFRVYSPLGKRFLNSYHNKGLAFSAETDEGMERFGCYPLSQCIDLGFIVQQYTGLKDSKGKEIYEGDFIRGMFDFGPAGYGEQILPVVWDNEKGYQWNDWDMSTIEVSGNIYRIG